MFNNPNLEIPRNKQEQSFFDRVTIGDILVAIRPNCREITSFNTNNLKDPDSHYFFDVILFKDNKVIHVDRDPVLNKFSWSLYWVNSYYAVNVPRKLTFQMQKDLQTVSDLSCFM